MGAVGGFDNLAYKAARADWPVTSTNGNDPIDSEVVMVCGLSYLRIGDSPLKRPVRQQ